QIRPSSRRLRFCHTSSLDVAHERILCRWRWTPPRDAPQSHPALIRVLAGTAPACSPMDTIHVTKTVCAGMIRAIYHSVRHNAPSLTRRTWSGFLGSDEDPRYKDVSISPIMDTATTWRLPVLKTKMTLNLLWSSSSTAP
ncbi:unnamed protein product, partial [Ranitomeya imitator]